MADPLLFSLGDLLFFFKTSDNSRLFTQLEFELRFSSIDFSKEFEKIELYRQNFNGTKTPLKISKLDYPIKGLPEIDFIGENVEPFGYNIIDINKNLIQITDIYFRSDRDKTKFSNILNRIYDNLEVKQSQIESQKKTLTVSWEDLGFHKSDIKTYDIMALLAKLLEKTDEKKNEVNELDY